MKLERAIEINEDLLRHYSPSDQPDEIDAIKLGIENIKLTLRLRADQPPMATQLLPGETLE